MNTTARYNYTDKLLRRIQEVIRDEAPKGIAKNDAAWELVASSDRALIQGCVDFEMDRISREALDTLAFDCLAKWREAFKIPNKEAA